MIMGDKRIKVVNGDLIEYEIYKLVDFYDPILRKPTEPFVFTGTGENLKQSEYLAYSLAETLSELQGIGLSANQVGLPWRVCALNMGAEIWTLFNPEIIEKSETLNTEFQEGCLSYPGLYLKIPRPNHIKVKFQAIGGQFVEKEFDGLTAVCVQHEIDHLDGVVYTDLVSPIKLDQAKRKVKQNLKKIKRNAIEISRLQAQEEKAKKKPSVQAADAPKIDIMIGEPGTISLEPKTPDKFVYSVG